MKSLVVFFSHGGNTRRVARTLASRLKADVDEIHLLQARGSGARAYAQCAIESMAGLTPAIMPAHHDPQGYEVVVVGTPIWCWSLSSPVRTWLLQQRAALQDAKLGFFCTMGGSGASIAFERMQALLHREPAAVMALNEAQLKQGVESEMDAFVAALRPSARKRSPAAASRGERKAGKASRVARQT